MQTIFSTSHCLAAERVAEWIAELVELPVEQVVELPA